MYIYEKLALLTLMCNAIIKYNNSIITIKHTLQFHYYNNLISITH